MFGQTKHDGAGAMNHLTPEIVIGAPANPAEPRVAAGRILTRHEANPRRKLPSRAKMMTVINRSDECRCDHGPDAGQLRGSLTGFVRPANAEKLPVEFIEPEIKGAKFFEQVVEESPREIRKLGGRNGVGRLRQKAPGALG